MRVVSCLHISAYLVAVFALAGNLFAAPEVSADELATIGKAAALAATEPELDVVDAALRRTDGDGYGYGYGDGDGYGYGDGDGDGYGP
jgi:hypothetical protein